MCVVICVKRNWRRQLSASAALLLVIISLTFLVDSEAKHGHGHSRSNGHRHGRLRGIRRAPHSAKQGAATKHLYCKLQGGCEQCQEDEEIERYCADTGFKELLRCTTNEELLSQSPVVLTYPYPPDVHIDDDRDPEEGPWGRSIIRVVRSCTEKTVAAHQEALAAEVAAAEQQHGGLAHMPLFNFELGMVLLLGLALPVVYWRKIRIRHL